MLWLKQIMDILIFQLLSKDNNMGFWLFVLSIILMLFILGKGTDIIGVVGEMVAMLM